MKWISFSISSKSVSVANGRVAEHNCAHRDTLDFRLTSDSHKSTTLLSSCISLVSMFRDIRIHINIFPCASEQFPLCHSYYTVTSFEK